MPAPFDPERLLRTLTRHDVAFVVIGGLGAVLHGAPTTTNDADICPQRTTANLERLAAALRELDARIRSEDTPDGVAFDRSAGFLGNVELLNLTTTAGDLDVALSAVGVGGYDDLVPSAVAYDIDGIEVLVASLDDVIHSKEAADRPKDRAVLPILRALRDELP